MAELTVTGMKCEGTEIVGKENLESPVLLPWTSPTLTPFSVADDTLSGIDAVGETDNGFLSS